MDIEPMDLDEMNAEIEAFELEYYEYLKNRTPEQEAEDNARDKRMLERFRADRERIFREHQEMIYRRLLAEIFKKK